MRGVKKKLLAVPDKWQTDYKRRVNELVQLYDRVIREFERRPVLFVSDKRLTRRAMSRHAQKYEQWRFAFMRMLGQYNCELEKLARIHQLFEWIRKDNLRAIVGSKRRTEVSFEFRVCVYHGRGGNGFVAYHPKMIKYRDEDGDLTLTCDRKALRDSNCPGFRTA